MVQCVFRRILLGYWFYEMDSDRQYYCLYLMKVFRIVLIKQINRVEFTNRLKPIQPLKCQSKVVADNILLFFFFIFQINKS